MWKGYSQERISRALMDKVLDDDDSANAFGDRWRMAVAVLGLMTRSEPVSHRGWRAADENGIDLLLQGRKFSLNQLVLEMSYPREDEFDNTHLDQLRLVLQVLAGVGLVTAPARKGRATYVYNGPDVAAARRADEFGAHAGEFGLRELSCPVPGALRELADQHEAPRAKNVLNNLFDGQSGNKFKYETAGVLNEPQKFNF